MMTSSVSSSDTSPADCEMCFIKRAQTKCYCWISDHSSVIAKIAICLLSLLYIVYYVAAMIYSTEGATVLTVFTSIAVCFVVCYWLLQRDGSVAFFRQVFFLPCKTFVNQHGRILKWLSGTTFLVSCVVFLSLVAIDSVRQVRAAAGAVVLLLTSGIFSKNLKAVQWKYVVTVLAIQFVLMILLTYTSAGYDVFHFITFYTLKYVLFCINGGNAVYGLFDHPLLIILTSVSTFVGTTLALLYSIGRPINLVRTLKRGISSMSDFQVHITLAMLYSFVTGVSVAPLRLAGLNARHLVVAMWTNATAAVAMTLVTFPTSRDTEIVRKVNTSVKQIQVVNNLYTRTALGAIYGLRTSLLFLALSMAFASIYAFCDVTVAWLGSRVGLEITLNSVLGYLFTPVAYIVGIDWPDCYQFGCLQAEKVFGQMTLALRSISRLKSSESITPHTAALSVISLCGFGTWTTFNIVISICWVVTPGHVRRYLRMWFRLAFNTHMACLYSTSIAAFICPNSFYTAQN